MVARSQRCRLTGLRSHAAADCRFCAKHPGFHESLLGGTLPFVSTLTKGQLPTVAYSGTYGTAFAALPASTPAFGLVNYVVPADAGGNEPPEYL